jgi:hypothetical protein
VEHGLEKFLWSADGKVRYPIAVEIAQCGYRGAEEVQAGEIVGKAA